MRILVVEDDPKTAEAVAISLTAAGYIVELEANGEEAWFKGDTEPYAAVVLDLGLPGMDGLSILRKWRQAGRFSRFWFSPLEVTGTNALRG